MAFCECFKAYARLRSSNWKSLSEDKLPQLLMTSCGVAKSEKTVSWQQR